MSIDVKFTRICEKSFAELSGEDALARHCNDCSLTVFNFDLIDDEARQQIIAIAGTANLSLCVTATVPIKTTAPPCALARVMNRPITGAIMTPENQERKRLEAERELKVKLAASAQIHEILENERQRIDPDYAARRKAELEQAQRTPEKPRSWLERLKFW